METLPEEIIQHILSYLPGRFLFKTVSLVSKHFHRLVYSRPTIISTRYILEEICLKTERDYWSFIMKKLCEVINIAPSGSVIVLSLMNGTDTWNFLRLFKNTCSMIRVLNMSNTKGNIGEDMRNYWSFTQLRELNVSHTNIGDLFLELVGDTCSHLFVLNISCCPLITQSGIEKAQLNLGMINMSSLQKFTPHFKILDPPLLL